MNKEHGFELHKSFEGKAFIKDMPLCRVLMESKEYPWILLIPRRANIVQINQLDEADSLELMKEIVSASNIVEKLFRTDRLNVAAIGNKTPQLHIHIVSRNENDSLWPETVWGKDMRSLNDSEKNERIKSLKAAFCL